MNFSFVKSFFRKTEVLIFFAGLLARIIARQFQTGVSADGVMRILLSWQWLEEPYFIMSHVWGTFHFYLIAFVIWITGDHITAPYYLNILLSSLIAPIIYKISLELFGNKTGAIGSAIFYTACPILFKLGLTSLSEIPFLLFLALSILMAIKGIKSGVRTLFYGLISGLMLAIASGFRIEAWIIIPMFALIILINKKTVLGFWFLVSACSYPAFWMFTSYLSTGDALYSIHESANWNLNIAGINENLDDYIIASRILVQPLALIFNLTPWVLFLVFFSLYKIRKSGELKLYQISWLIPVAMLFLLYQIKIFQGDLAMHNRYYSTILIIFIPFISAIAIIIKEQFFKILILGSSVFTFTFSFFQNDFAAYEDLFRFNNAAYTGVQLLRNNDILEEDPIPLIYDKQTLEYEKIISANIAPGNGLIIDFIGWNETTNIILKSGISFEQFALMMEGAIKNNYDLVLLNDVTGKFKTGLILLKKNSPKWQFSVWDKENKLLTIDTIKFEVSNLYSDERVDILKYSRLSNP